VTSAMKQDGENRVGLIKSETAFKVSQQLAEAASSRPRIVGQALNEIARQDEEILESVLDVMETDQLLTSNASIDLIPEGVTPLIELGDSSKDVVSEQGGLPGRSHAEGG